MAKGGIITLTKTTAIQTQEYGIKVRCAWPTRNCRYARTRV
ncbi:MAG: hypothetical protein ACLTLQ_15475 [[Clostridium] scindens]